MLYRPVKVPIGDPAFTRYLCASVLGKARGIAYRVSDHAPDEAPALFALTSLVVWSGASDQTAFGDPSVNHAFRAVHDSAHLAHRLDFTAAQEIALARIQANQFADCGDAVAQYVLDDLAGQTLYRVKHGEFPADQRAFHLALNVLR